MMIIIMILMIIIILSIMKMEITGMKRELYNLVNVWKCVREKEMKLNVTKSRMMI